MPCALRQRVEPRTGRALTSTIALLGACVTGGFALACSTNDVHGGSADAANESSAPAPDSAAPDAAADALRSDGGSAADTSTAGDATPQGGSDSGGVGEAGGSDGGTQPLIFDGRARQMTQLSVNTTVNQSPAIWSPQFCDPDIYLESDVRFGKVYHVHTDSSSTLSCPAGGGPIWSPSVAYASLNHSYETAILGTTLYYVDSIKLLPAYNFVDPGWESLMQMSMGPMNSPLQIELYAPDPSWGPTPGGLMLGRHWGVVDCMTWNNSDQQQLYADASSLVGHWVD